MVVTLYDYPSSSPSHYVGQVLTGLVSYVETDFFWLQMEPEKVTNICLDELGEETIGVWCEGECVVVLWEGALYRGIIGEEVGEGEVNVTFVDWGNSAVLTMDNMRKATAEEMEFPVGAVRCKLLGRKIKGWEGILEKFDFKVELKCLAIYNDVYLMKENTHTSPSVGNFPLHKNIPGIVTNVSKDRTSLWFCPASTQSGLDSIMNNLDHVATLLTPLPFSQVFPGQLCAAKFSVDAGMYRARVSSMMKEKLTVFFIDYGDEEDKVVNDQLYMLPWDLLLPSPSVVEVETENIVSIEQEDKMMQGEVVLRVEMRDGGRRLVKFFIDSEEIVFLPEKVEEKYLPVGVKIEVSLGFLESVCVVWVTPVYRVEGIDASLEMVDSVSELLKNCNDLETVATPQVAQMVVTRFSEDGMLYRGKVEEGGVVRFIDFGNMELMREDMVYKLPVELERFPAGAFRVEIEIEEAFENSVITIEAAEEALCVDDLFLVLNQAGLATFFNGDLAIQIFNPNKGVANIDKVAKDNIIEVSESDETVEFKDEEDQSQSDPAVSVSVPVTVNRIETVSSVWVTRTISYPALDSMMDQLAVMDQLADFEDKLATLSEVAVGDGVVARFSCDSKLYRGKVVSINGQVATVLYIDFGDTELHPVRNLLEMPRQFRDLEPLAELVRLAGGELLEDSTEMREVIDSALDIEGLTMVLREEEGATFWEGGEKIELFKEALKQEDHVSTEIKHFSSTNDIKDKPSAECKLEDLTHQLSKLDCSKQVKPNLELIKELTLTYNKDSTPQSNKLMAPLINEEFSTKTNNIITLQSGEELRSNFNKKFTTQTDKKLNLQSKTLLETHSLPKLPPHSPSKFIPTSSMPNDVLSDWISGCEEMMEARETPNISKMSPKQFLSYSRTPSGSETLQRLLNTGDQIAQSIILKSVMSCKLMNMITQSLSCKVVQKLLSHVKLDQLMIPIIDQFHLLSLHPSGHQAVLAALAVGSPDQRDMITTQLEDENILMELIRDKNGCFVGQRCISYLLPRTISSIVERLERKMLDVACHPHGSFFVQEFFKMFAGKDGADILQDEIMDSLDSIVFSKDGHRVVEMIIKLGDPNHICIIANWIMSNMQMVLLDCTGVFVARTLVQQLFARSRKGVQNNWSQLMDKLVEKMLDTLVTVFGNRLPLFIAAATHHAGHVFVLEVVKQMEWLGSSREKLILVLKQHKQRLMVDMFGAKGGGGKDVIGFKCFIEFEYYCVVYIAIVAV